MILEVAMLPSQVRDGDQKLCVIIDVLRAGTSLACMADAGVRQVVIASDPLTARQLASEIGTNAILCGETGGRKPDDFDLGNSPGPYLNQQLLARDIVFCSSNGSRAMHLLDGAPAIMAGALCNATAVATAAVELARLNNVDICLVASGDNHGARFSLEDVFCAGLMVESILRSIGGTENLVSIESLMNGDEPSERMALDESAIAANRIFRSYRDAPDNRGKTLTETSQSMMLDSLSARSLHGWGFGEDVELCSRVDSSTSVMHVTNQGGRLIASPFLGPDAPTRKQGHIDADRSIAF